MTRERAALMRMYPPEEAGEASCGATTAALATDRKTTQPEKMRAGTGAQSMIGRCSSALPPHDARTMLSKKGNPQLVTKLIMPTRLKSLALVGSVVGGEAARWSSSFEAIDFLTSAGEA